MLPRGCLTAKDGPASATRGLDEQIRRHPIAGAFDGYVEYEEKVIRCISGADGWNGVTWSALSDSNADAVIAAQIGRFQELGRPWEWKHYSYDEPGDWSARRLAAGFTRDPDETRLVA